MLDDQQVENFWRQLLRRQQELRDLRALGAEASGIVELDQTRVGRLSRMDALQGQAMAKEQERRRTLELQRIAVALTRIENREYGYCIKCDDAIVVARLAHDPSVLLCIACANAAEQ